MFVMNMSWPNRIWVLFIFVYHSDNRILWWSNWQKGLLWSSGHFCVQRGAKAVQQQQCVLWGLSLGTERRLASQKSNWAWGRRRQLGILAEVERVLKEELQDFKNVRLWAKTPKFIGKIYPHGHMVATWGFFGASKSKEQYGAVEFFTVGEGALQFFHAFFLRYCQSCITRCIST